MNVSSQIGSDLFETLGILSISSVQNDFLNEFKNLAITKLEEETLKIRGSLYYVKKLDPKDAKELKDIIQKRLNILSDIQKKIELLSDLKYNDFKVAALDYIDAIHTLYSYLEDVTDIHSSYLISHNILEDWNEPENDHWDNY